MNVQVRQRDKCAANSRSRQQQGRWGATSHRVQIVLFPGFHLTELAACLDVFDAVNVTAGSECFSVRIVSTEGGCIASSTGLGVDTECIYPHSGTVDFMFLPGCAKTSENHAALRLLLRKRRNYAGCVVALSTAVDLLVQMRVLNADDVSTHWSFHTLVRDYIAPKNRKLVHKSEGIITSAGFVGTYDLLLHMVAGTHGWKLAGDVSDHMIKGEVRYEDARSVVNLSRSFSAMYGCSPHRWRKSCLHQPGAQEAVRLDDES